MIEKLLGLRQSVAGLEWLNEDRLVEAAPVR
jgi:hypothetical protein